VKRPRLAGAAALTGIAAVLVAGYAAAGLTGLIDVASVTALGVLIAARGTLRGPRPRTVLKESQQPRSTLRTDDFPAFAKIASDLEWAQVSQRHYEHLLRPALARLAATLSRPNVDLTGPPAKDTDGPGADRATLERIVSELEGGQR
jgi:hypothetical protein